MNSRGINLPDRNIRVPLMLAMEQASGKQYAAQALIGGKPGHGEAVASINPAQTSETVGTCELATEEHVEEALHRAVAAQPNWNATPASKRAEILNKAADLFEGNRAELLSLCIKEAGKTLPDAISELREAGDVLRDYAVPAESHCGKPTVRRGPEGERNEDGWRGPGGGRAGCRACRA